MPLFRITYRETMEWAIVVEADSESAARQSWIDEGPYADVLGREPSIVPHSEVDHEVLSVEAVDE